MQRLVGLVGLCAHVGHIGCRIVRHEHQRRCHGIAVGTVGQGAHFSDFLEHHRRHAIAEIATPQVQAQPLVNRGARSQRSVGGDDVLPCLGAVVDIHHRFGVLHQRFLHIHFFFFHLVHGQDVAQGRRHLLAVKGSAVHDGTFHVLQLLEKVDQCFGRQFLHLLQTACVEIVGHVAVGHFLDHGIGHTAVAFINAFGCRFCCA